MSMRTFGFVPTWALMLGLVWMMSHADRSLAQRSGLGSFRSSTSGILSSRSETNRQGNLTNSQATSAGRSSGLGQPAAPGGPSAQPQGRDFQEGSFVGRDAQDVRETFRNLTRGQGRRAMMDIVIENLNDMRESRKRWRDQQRQPPAVRVQLRPAFDYPGVSIDQVTSGVQSRLTALHLGTVLQGPVKQGPALQERDVRPLSVELKGRTATLRGTVRSAHEKLLAGQLVAIEPGISKVENLLVVEE